MVVGLRRFRNYRTHDRARYDSPAISGRSRFVPIASGHEHFG